MKERIFSFLCIVLLFGRAYGQESVPDFSIGARNSSLANANISECADVSTMYQNPAAIAFLESRSVFLNHFQENGTPGMQENLAVPLVLTNPVAIALGLDAYHFGYLHRFVASNQRVLEYGYDMAMAAEITPTLSVGGSAALRRGATGSGSQAWGSYFSVGANYDPTPDISYSLVWNDLGKDVSYYLNDTALTAVTTPTSTIIEVGATMAYPSSASLRPPLFILSLASEKILGITGLYYRGGIEIRPAPFLELRFGYVAGPGLASARYGVGYIAGILDLQYAVYPQPGTRALIQQFSFGMDL